MFIVGKIVDWERRKTKEAVETDGSWNSAKCFGLGALEGVIDVCAVFGAAVIIIDIAKETVTIIKK